MEVFILVLIVIGFIVLIERAKAEEEENKKKEVRKKNESRLQRLEEERQQGLKKKNIDASKEFINQLVEIIEENKYRLLEERRKLVKKDSYGKEDTSRWVGNPTLKPSYIELGFLIDDLSGEVNDFKKGIPYFWFSVILPAVGGTSKPEKNLKIFFKKWKNYRLVNPEIEDLVKGKTRKVKEEDWYVAVASLVEDKCLELLNNSTSTKSNRSMSGIEFEEYCKSILEEAGWEVEDTPTSGDQGVDLIASIEDVRVCIQCKCFAKAVGNKAVQEVAAGMIHWKGTHAVVVAKSGFTKSAKTLAASNKVILTSDSELENLENLVL